MIRFTVGARSVDIPSYQWGYKAGTAYLERSLGETPAGHVYRNKVGTTARVLTVQFHQSDAGYVSPLRELLLYAMRSGQRVQFFPDTTDLGTYRWIDLQPALDVQHGVEGRLRVEIPLVEQPA